MAEAHHKVHIFIFERVGTLLHGNGPVLGWDGGQSKISGAAVSEGQSYKIDTTPGAGGSEEQRIGALLRFPAPNG
jgi:hypothetical protein